jgi:hypothetical protein
MLAVEANEDRLYTIFWMLGSEYEVLRVSGGMARLPSHNRRKHHPRGFPELPDDCILYSQLKDYVQGTHFSLQYREASSKDPT